MHHDGAIALKPNRLHHPMLRQDVVHAHPAFRVPAGVERFGVVAPADFGDLEIVNGEALAVNARVSYYLEAQPNALPSEGC